MYIMQVGGPPPFLGLRRTYHVNDQINAVPLEIRISLINEANQLLLLDHPNITPQEKQQLKTYMKEKDQHNMDLLKGLITTIKLRLNLQGGRRKRTRRNKKSKKAKKSKKSMRRRR
jgi:hypothetical protein